MGKTDKISPERGKSLSVLILSDIKKFDAVIFSDYDHGTMVPEFVIPILEEAIKHNKKIIVDSKAIDTFPKYNNSSIILPNNIEAKLIVQDKIQSEEELAKTLLKKMNLDAVGLTLGYRGIMLCIKDKEEIEILPPLDLDNKEVVDVTGAGDTVCASVAVGLAYGLSYRDSLRLSNIAAGIVVRKLGVVTANKNEINREMEINGIQIP
jgi:D-beta-D-heptose 7-phosphate kinase/D-beta-D-heptose 1-phosphate adenosyltransferase